MTCECCKDEAKPNVVGVPEFSCGCMDELVCRACNRCKKHCQCAPETQALDIAYRNRLAIAAYEWGLMGVRF